MVRAIYRVQTHMWGPSLQLDDRHRIQIPISERSSGWATNYISIRGERIIQYSSEALVFILVWHMAQLVSHSNCPPIQLVPNSGQFVLRSSGRYFLIQFPQGKRKTQTLRFQGKCEMQQILYFK